MTKVPELNLPKPNLDKLLAECGKKAGTGNLTYGQIQAVKAIVANQVAEARIVTGETSDGYHTFNELYEYRKLYNALLFNEWYQTKNYGIHKSKRHSDGNLCFGGGWFVVAAELPTGQVTNHYELKDWGLFKVEERHKAVKYDGHTPQEAAERLRATLNGVKNK